MPPLPFSLLDARTRRQHPPAALLGRHVPASLHDLRLGAPDFVMDDQLAAAVNVALAIGAPLLVTGEPGCGKTQLAYHLAWVFQVLEADKLSGDRERDRGLGPQPFRLQVKSTTTARDLLWSFDTVSWFHDGQDKAKAGQPLDKRSYRTRGPLWEAFEALQRERPAVVLIDEIDKAPRDFANDLLHELDQFRFECSDTGEPVERPRGVAPPLVVVTSNAERRLPEAFLRRCVFHHLELTDALIRDAVARRATSLEIDPALQKAAVDRLLAIRKLNLRKRPSTGEALAWLWVLHASGVQAEALRTAPQAELPHIGALIKDRDDLATLGVRARG